MTYFVDESEYLEHYGVKGMKWGVRHERKKSSTISSLKKHYRENKGVNLRDIAENGIDSAFHLALYEQNRAKQANSKTTSSKRFYKNKATDEAANILKSQRKMLYTLDKNKASYDKRAQRYRDKRYKIYQEMEAAKNSGKNITKLENKDNRLARKQRKLDTKASNNHRYYVLAGIKTKKLLQKFAYDGYDVDVIKHRATIHAGNDALERIMTSNGMLKLRKAGL